MQTLPPGWLPRTCVSLCGSLLALGLVLTGWASLG